VSGTPSSSEVLDYTLKVYSQKGGITIRNSTGQTNQAGVRDDAGCASNPLSRVTKTTGDDETLDIEEDDEILNIDKDDEFLKLEEDDETLDIEEDDETLDIEEDDEILDIDQDEESKL
jgi:hypothetical protein